MSTDIIPLVDFKNELRVSSETLAERLGREHSATIKLIRRYLPELEGFGQVGFQIRLTGKAGSDIQYALLNEDQCFFVLSLSKNNQTVVKLKGDMVKAFAKARKGGIDLSMLDPAMQVTMQLAIDHSLMKQEQERQSQRLDQIEATIKSGTGYQTVSAWGKMNGAPMSLSTASELGRKCAAKCKKLDIRIGKVPDERFGSVGSYPIEVIDECAEEMAS